jgi:pentapeptide MXKDX repeat protein
MLKLLTALAFGTALLLGFASPPSPSYAQDVAQADDMSDSEGMTDEAPAGDEMTDEAPAGDEMMTDEAPAEDPMGESEDGASE